MLANLSLRLIIKLLL